MDGSPKDTTPPWTNPVTNPLTNAVFDNTPNPADSTDGPELIAALTEKLRLLRLVSQQRRYHGRPTPRLPSKRAIIEVLNDAVSALYPRHFGPVDLQPDQTDSFVASMLASIRDRLSALITTELMLAPDASPDTAQHQGESIAREFVAQLIIVRDLHDTDILAAYKGDPSAQSLDEVAFCFPGVAAILHHRIAHTLYRSGIGMIARIMAEHSHSLTGIDIHPGAKIGPAFFIDHGTGVVIGETAVIGRNVRLYQQVTLGAKSFHDDGSGSLVKGEPRHPIIGDDVVIYAGATILGRITLGKGAVIGGGVWLLASVAPGAVVTQARPQLRMTEGGTAEPGQQPDSP
ncbi:serine acetyltransferase [Xinfangfangia sp. D13-10-4-6]|uniref:serine O-acetyltransferase n=1 Tax=Pseudogemmobacter hezensis TaxID=2737662 RepID=UPI001554AB77|nr:serine acetyltransferase [Pseudogemmobacter hezensis]NPD16038.1 serine acetyltransferase [Pseudogemmobacter hezensis]